MDNPTTLDESMLAALVDAFYEKVRRDDLIGPVFNAAVHDWPEHKRLLTSFWASIVLRAGTYHGNPMAVHRGLDGVRVEHFERWLSMWADTAREQLGQANAQVMLAHAQRIGQSLRYGMGLDERSQGRPLGLPVRNQ